MSDTPSGEGQGKERFVDVSQAQGVQIGSHNRQVNYVTQIVGGQVARPPRVTAHGEIESPYKGLGAFGEDDAAFFFGRDQATSEVLGRLTRRLDTPVPLVVSGASGAGKSSLLRAGVLPRMAADGLPGVMGARLWPRAVFTPARAPLAELAAAVAPLAGTNAAALHRSLVADPAGLGAIAHSIARIIPNGPGRLVLVIDQFEQVFTQCADDSDRRAFISALHAAATVGHGTAQVPAAVVVLVVRADFEARCAEHEELAEAVQSRYFLTPMTESQLRFAITGPAQVAHATVEPALADELARAARGSSSGVLAHLSHALDQAWRNRAGDDVLSLADYERAGGIEGSIAASADRAFGSLAPGQQAAVRPVFLRLVTVSSDLVVSAGRATRSDLFPGSPPSDVHAVVETFAAERLLTVGEDSVEVSHEVLLDAWGRLRDWLAEDRIDLARYSRLAADARDWESRGRPASYLYPPGRLAEVDAAAKRWASVPGRYPALGRVSQGFLDAARRAARKSRLLKRGFAVGLAALTVAAVIGAALAGHFALTADRQNSIANSRALAALSLSLEQSDPLAAGQFAVAAWRESPTSQAASAMTTILARQERSGELPAGPPNSQMHVALSPDGTLLATVNQGSPYLRIWDTASGKPVGMPLPVGPRSSDVGGDVAFSPDGNLVASADAHGHVRLWNPGTGALVRSFPAVAGPSVAFSPDGKLLASGSYGGDIYRWNAITGKPVGMPLQAAGASGDVGVIGVAFSPDGKLLASAESDGYVRLWNAVTGKAVGAPLPADPGYLGVNGIAFSPDGKLLASADADGSVRLWNPATAEPAGKLQASPGPSPGQPPGVTSVAFSPDGTLVTAGADGGIKLWNPATSKPIGAPLPANPDAGPVTSVAFSSQSGLLASSDANGAIQLWDLKSHLPVGATLNRADDLLVRFSAAARLLGAHAEGYAEPWLSAGVKALAEPSPDDFAISPTLSVSPDGKAIAMPASKGRAQLISAAQDWFLPAAPGKGNAVTAVAFSPDGKLLATADKTGRVRLWDTGTGVQVGPSLPADTLKGGGIPGLAFSPDGKVLAVADFNGRVTLWNLVTGSRLRPPLLADTGSSGGVGAVAFSPDGRLLASADWGDGTTKLWNLATGRVVGTLRPGRSVSLVAGLGGRFHSVGGATAVAFNPDGALLAVGYADGTIQLWNPATRAPVGSPLPPSTTGSGGGSLITALRFSPDGSLLLSADNNQNVNPWEVWRYANPYAALCDEAGPPAAGIWRLYASGIPEPSGTCAGVPPASALHD